MMLAPAAAGKFQLFQNQDAGAFADHESVAVGIPRTAGFFGSIVARGKRSHSGETADAHGSDGSFRAAGDHDVGITAGDDFEGIADGVSAGGTGGASGLVGAFGVVADADVASRQVDDGRRNKKWRDLARAAIEQVGVFAFDHIESADARSDVNAHARGQVVVHLQAGHAHGFLGGGQGQVNEPAHFFQLFLLDELQGIEVLDLGRDLAGELRGVEPGDASHAALACKQVLPHFFRGIAYRANQSDSSNYDPATQLLPTFRILPDIVDGILHGADLFRVFVGNFNLESFLEGHDQFHGIQRVGA